MAPIIAAIAAAFLAGSVALYRERRQELRSLLVAGRVMGNTFLEASAVIGHLSESEEWDISGEPGGLTSFSAAWEEHRNVLAAHLTRPQWASVESAARRYLLAMAQQGQAPPSRFAKQLSDTADSLLAAAATLAAYSEKVGAVRNPGRGSQAYQASDVQDVAATLDEGPHPDGVAQIEPPRATSGISES